MLKGPVVPAPDATSEAEKDTLSLFLSLALPLFVLRLPFSEVSDAIPIAVE